MGVRHPVSQWHGGHHAVDNTSAGSAAASGVVTVNAQPSGVAIPAYGFVPVVVDGFSVKGPAIGAAGSLWGPNRYANVSASGNVAPGFNSDEVALFDSAQVTIGGSGLQLAATNTPGYGAAMAALYPGAGFQTAAYIRSAMVMSKPVAGPDSTQGWPTITGCMWNPISTGVRTVIECVCSWPALTVPTYGMDNAVWWSDNPEFDNPEMTGFLANNPGGTSAIWATINHTTTVEMEAQVFGNPGANNWQQQGGLHVLTTDIDPVGQTITPWVDGVQVAAPFSFSPSMATTAMYAILSGGWRAPTGAAYTGQFPTFTGTNFFTVRSWAMYQPSNLAPGGFSYPATFPYFVTGTVANVLTDNFDTHGTTVPTNYTAQGTGSSLSISNAWSVSAPDSLLYSSTTLVNGDFPQITVGSPPGPFGGFPTIPGTKLTVSAAVKINSLSGNAIGCQIVFFDKNDTQLANTNCWTTTTQTGVVQLKSGTLTAPASANNYVILFFSNSSGGVGSFAIDNLSVTASS